MCARARVLAHSRVRSASPCLTHLHTAHAHSYLRVCVCACVHACTRACIHAHTRLILAVISLSPSLTLTHPNTCTRTHSHLYNCAAALTAAHTPSHALACTHSKTQAPPPQTLLAPRKPRDAKDKYAFWETQPVPQFTAEAPAEVS